MDIDTHRVYLRQICVKLRDLSPPAGKRSNTFDVLL